MNKTLQQEKESDLQEYKKGIKTEQNKAKKRRPHKEKITQ
ncbi:hypothetical protein LEP1GSC062_4333 [Leptospira alexanderi serovar Manhao 3 str. L 60]|uniref:Uncharacterized protein n=1 Tax=Leptospira alexanderi serovar Manhao 3 str. L 60 TaxID=1049759 RepID=V6HUX5_9LEPT|nr:hypothetical protein LEP1GSC062_4333 [Leptospira alexanderi serovar Manhao 3 str. L 60]